MERIAAAAGVNKQLLFHYFVSKAGLHKAVADAAGSRLDLDSTGRGTPGERLRDLVLRLAAAAPELGALLGDDTRQRARRAAVRIIEDGQRSGHFRDDVSPDPVAEIVVAASLGYGRGAVTGRPAGVQATDFAVLLARIVADYCAWR